ncbi:MAG: copper resistance protein CopC [Chloroflexi bacterium]|nr:copper resistance protein CopC [Chloroflexota bacterium]
MTLWPRSPRVRILAMLGLLLVPILSGCAASLPARPRLIASSPAPDATIGLTPTRLELHFSEPVLPSSSVDVRDPRGALVSTAADSLDPQLVVATLPAGLGDGVYSVDWHAVAAGGHQALDGSYSYTVASGAPAHPRLTLSRGLADVGDPVLISGTDFTPNAAVAVTIADDDQPLTSVNADAGGNFSVPVQMPNDVPFGDQPIQAKDGSGAGAVADLVVRWGGWPPLRVFTNGEPGPGPGQITFTVSGRNRSDYTLEGLRVLLDVPQGAQVVWASTGATQAGGQLIWSLPPVDRSTIQPSLATFAVAGPMQTQARVEFAHRRPRGCIGDPCLPAFVDSTLSMSSVISPGQ